MRERSGRERAAEWDEEDAHYPNRDSCVGSPSSASSSSRVSHDPPALPPSRPLHINFRNLCIAASGVEWSGAEERRGRPFCFCSVPEGNQLLEKRVESAERERGREGGTDFALNHTWHQTKSPDSQIVLKDGVPH